jgi:hypothetical protein
MWVFWWAWPLWCDSSCPAGNGFFINTALTMLTVHASLWVLLLLALGELTGGTAQKWLWSVQVLQLGSLSVVVYWVTLVLEAGLFSSVWTILRQMLQGKEGPRGCTAQLLMFFHQKETFIGCLLRNYDHTSCRVALHSHDPCF